MASKFLALARSSVLLPSLRGLTAINLSHIKIPQNNFAVKPKKKEDLWKARQPKRAPSPFALYVRENFQSTKEENSSLKTPQLLTALADEWHSAPENEKDKYRMQSDRLKAEYQEKLEEYKSTLPPPLPKRPVSSSYTLFIKENFGRVHEQNPKLTFSEIQKEMAKEWHELSLEEKEVYRTKLEDMNQKYIQHVIEYERDLTDEGREFIEMQNKGGLKKLRKKKLEFMNYPKKPGGAFFIFLEKEKENFARGPDESQKEWVKRMGLNWKLMRDDEKTVYRDIQEKKQQEYKSEVAEWKSKFQLDKLGGVVKDKSTRVAKQMISPEEGPTGDSPPPVTSFLSSPGA